MTEKRPNRLVHEKSPYLRQHAHNPVQWHPWDDIAFAEAKKQNKPVFLSIGYSTCHWCHVMERESFADEEVADLINKVFVPVKVDREERPDIDDAYMAVCQLLTGSGGWPLTILLTPDKKPFFAGTYFPKESRFGLIGLKDLLSRIGEAWKDRNAELLRSADNILAALEKSPLPSSRENLPAEILDTAYTHLAGQFDHERGGFGGAPKFPTPHHLTFLFRYYKRTHDETVLAMARKTLRAMRMGGIFDHLGYGFHRYSTDAEWRVPHFEKMLYDQALLAMAYTEAFQLLAREECGQTVDKIITYVLRDMTSREGGFYTAEDADSEGKEGKFYLWTEEEIKTALAPAEADLAVKIFNIRPEGNFTEAGGHTTGNNILFFLRPLADQAAEMKIPVEDLKNRLSLIERKLFAAREKRPRPLKDTKILTDWNGLMIAALAKASQALGTRNYTEAAQKAAGFIRQKMVKEGRLCHRYAEGEASIPAFLDDYAFLLWGLLELYEAAFDVSLLEWALELVEALLRNFWDESQGGFFLTSREVRDLPLRRKDVYDGALPSGNSVMVLNLLRLGRLLSRPDFEEKAQKITAAFSGRITPLPMAHTQLLCGLDFAWGPAHEIVIVGRSGAADTQLMIKALQQEFIPNKVAVFRPAEVESPEILRYAPYARPMMAINGKATAYVCTNYQCRIPATKPEDMLAYLRKS